MKKNILLLIVLIILAGSVNAQNPQWINYTNGNNITALADAGNCLWIGTGGGLVKIDKSTDIPTFYNCANSGLTSHSISSIAVDSNGDIWIGFLDWGPNGGLAKFDGTNWTIYNTSNSDLPCNAISSIAIEPSGTIWIGLFQCGTNGGLVKFDGTNWTIYNTSNSGLPDNTIYTIAIDESGINWIGTFYQLCHFRIFCCNW